MGERRGERTFRGAGTRPGPGGNGELTGSSGAPRGHPKADATPAVRESRGLRAPTRDRSLGSCSRPRPLTCSKWRWPATGCRPAPPAHVRTAPALQDPPCTRPPRSYPRAPPSASSCQRRKVTSDVDAARRRHPGWPANVPAPGMRRRCIIPRTRKLAFAPLVAWGGLRLSEWNTLACLVFVSSSRLHRASSGSFSRCGRATWPAWYLLGPSKSERV